MVLQIAERFLKELRGLQEQSGVLSAERGTERTEPGPRPRRRPPPYPLIGGAVGRQTASRAYRGVAVVIVVSPAVPGASDRYLLRHAERQPAFPRAAQTSGSSSEPSGQSFSPSQRQPLEMQVTWSRHTNCLELQVFGAAAERTERVSRAQNQGTCLVTPRVTHPPTHNSWRISETRSRDQNQGTRPLNTRVGRGQNKAWDGLQAPPGGEWIPSISVPQYLGQGDPRPLLGMQQGLQAIKGHLLLEPGTQQG
ncbi:unnamed protein product [Arctogadus glacialis]